jgi:uncharacterized membrane protein YesL
MKLIKNDVISGTEDETTKKEVKDFKEKFQKYKEDYIKNNTIESMVYENGSALALLYKEVMRLNQLLTSNLQTDEQTQK